MRYLVLVSLLITATYTFAQAAANTHSADEFLRVEKGHAEPAVLAHYTVDASALQKIVSGTRLQLTGFPGAENEFVTLDLRAVRSPLDATTQVVVGTSGGESTIAMPTFRAFRGVVLGEPHSRVFLSALDDRLFVSILRESGEQFVLGPAKNSADPALHVFARETDLLSLAESLNFNCIADDITQPNPLVPIDELLHDGPGWSPGNHSLSTNALLQVDIAVEADSCFYAAGGSNLTTVLAYIASLYAMSSAIYEDEANITWHVTWVKVWQSGDPYHVAGNAYALEPLIVPYWKVHYANVPRDLAHVMTSIYYGGGGYGWFSLCDTNWSYSMSSPETGKTFPTFAFTYDSYIVAHEIGHNFSLPHSHTCYWAPPLDTCWTKNDPVHGLSLGDACDSLPITPRRSPGTIMSYCANANYTLSGNDFSQFKLAMTFSPRVATVMRTNAEKAPCVQPPLDTTLILISPRGSETFAGDTIIAVEWSYAHIDSVSLDYTTNGGSSWSSIATGLTAASNSYNWKVPNVASTKMLVRVRNAAPASLVADTSLIVSTVTQHAASVAAAGPEGLEFAISPDPAGDFLIVKPSSDCTNVIAEILDVQGKVLGTFDGSTISTTGMKLSLKQIPAGAYFLRLSSPVGRIIPFSHLR